MEKTTNYQQRHGMGEVSNGEAHFHYSRDERLKHPSHFGMHDDADRRRQMRRRLYIIILDIVLIIAVYLIYVFFLRPDPSSAELQGVRVHVQAGYFDQNVLVRVDAERTQLAGETTSLTAPDLMKVQIKDITSGDLLAETVDTIDAQAGAERKIYVELDVTAFEGEAFPESVLIIVSCGEESHIFEQKLEEY